MSTTPRAFSLSREEVYELVWTHPIQKLAFEWGLSDVGLAKILNSMAIPRPGRGYWAKIAAGERPKRTRLPVSRDSTDVLHVYRSPLADQPMLEPPVVEVSAKITHPHEIVRWLVESLAKAPTDQYGRLCIGDRYHAPFSVRPQNKVRALRVLDALIKALVARGNQVMMGRRYPHSSTNEIVVRAGDLGIPLEIEEALEREPHVLTRKEKRYQSRWGSTNAPTYDYVPKDRLRLSIAHAPHGYRKRKWWRDDDEHGLEDTLGRAVQAIEDVVKITVVEEEDARKRAHQAELDRRERLRHERMSRYHKWLAEDLEQMVAAWQRARGIREFLEEYKRRLAGPEDIAKTACWRQAAMGLADQLDPLSRIADVAKDMQPSDDALERLVGKPGHAYR
jgi:hypothetical protein